MIVNEYFQSYQDYFWQWEDNAEVVAIPDHSTIAYRAFIKDVLEKLSDQGVPPFGALLAAIIATNPQGIVALNFLNLRFTSEIKKEGNSYLQEAFDFLKILSGIPEEYKTGNKRILVLQALFENCHNVFSVKNSKEIIRWYFFNKENGDAFSEKKELKHTTYSKDFRTISLLASRFRSVEDILKKVASLPEITEVVIPDETVAKGNSKQTFIDELIADNRTFHIGILAERILSGLNIPFHRSLADQQPLGGISDVTNKGSFDKLLLSEFANEDILFLSRLANNEALYIEREIPPSNNKLKRIFLIDTSLRNWGTPKSIAFATMLAIVKAPGTVIECASFAIGHSYKPVVLDSIGTLIEGLQILEGSADAADGLALYFKENPPDKDTELFVFTESSAAKQAVMHNSMSTYGAFISYYIHTDFDGNIDVFKKQQKSLKHIQHIQLPLEELLKKRPVEIKPNARKESVTGYPILVRNASNVKQQYITSDGNVYQLTGEKALVRKYDRYTTDKNEKGWEIIQENLPFADGFFEIVELNNGEQLLFMFNPNKKLILLFNINTGDKNSIAFNEYQHTTAYKTFIYFDPYFYHKNHHSGNVWRIGIDGTVEIDNTTEPYMFKERVPQKYESDKQFSPGAFKNINDIYINENNRLVFNVHELQIKSNIHIKLDKATNKVAITASTKAAANDEFVFHDGSSIEVNRSGILILKSSDETIPIIYIPSIIDSTLGIAAGDEFTGNGYYYKSPLVEVILRNPGVLDSRVIIQVIHEHTQKNRVECEDLIKSGLWPKTIVSRISVTKANKVKQALEAINAVVEIKELASKEGKLTIISPALFYTKYIQAFVTTIQSYGAKN
jgi:hypothetical protein